MKTFEFKFLNNKKRDGLVLKIMSFYLLYMFVCVKYYKSVTVFTLA